MESYKQKPTNWRIVLKPAILHQNTDIMSWKSKKKAFWIDFWIYEGKNKKELDYYEHKQIHN